MKILCTLANINYSFGKRHIFQNASFTISQSDRVGLIGLNGKGKSLLFKIIANLVTPDISTPPFRYDKINDSKNPFSVLLVPQIFPTNYRFKKLENFVFNFYPEIGNSIFELEVVNKKIDDTSTNKSETELKSLLEQQKRLLEKIEQKEGWKIQQSYQTYLKYFGLKDFSQDIQKMSGGEQRRILISIGLSSSATIVLWDEPTNHLDIESIKKFEDELNYSEQTFVIVTHDRYLLSKITSKIFHINSDGVIENFNGSYTEYLQLLSDRQFAKESLINKLQNRLRRETAWMRQGIKARGTRSKKRVENFVDLKKTIYSLKANAKDTINLKIVASNNRSQSIVDINDLTFDYGGKQIFSNINLKIQRGDKIGVMGQSGSGKTTLMNLIANKLQSTKGTIKRKDAIEIKYFTQNRDNLDMQSTPFKTLGDGTDQVILPNNQKLHIYSYFESFLFDREDIHRPLETFSGGELNRLQLAKNLTSVGDIWIFDEPTNDLDLKTIEILEDTLNKFEGTLLIVSHDRAFLGSVTNKIWLLQKNGIEVFTGGYSQAEEYLDLVELESLIQEESDDSESNKNSEKIKNVQQELSRENVGNKKGKLTYQEKELLKVLPQKIQELENKLNEIEEKIASFDFSNTNSQSSVNSINSYTELSKQRELIEMQLMELYEFAEKHVAP